MSIIFIAKGTAKMGRTKRDKDGNIVESIPAQFTFDDTGRSVAIGELDPDTFQPKEPITELFGDWDTAAYLTMVLDRLKPSIQNIPDFASIINAARKDGIYFCDYCKGINCGECVVNEWMEDNDV